MSIEKQGTVTFDEETPIAYYETTLPEGLLVISGTITPPEDGAEGATYPLVSISENPGFSHWLEAVQAGRKGLPAKRWMTIELIARFKGGEPAYTLGFSGQGAVKATLKPMHLGVIPAPVKFTLSFDGERVEYDIGGHVGVNEVFLKAEAGDDVVVCFGFPNAPAAQNKPPIGAVIEYEINDAGEAKGPVT